MYLFRGGDIVRYVGQYGLGEPLREITHDDGRLLRVRLACLDARGMSEEAGWIRQVMRELKIVERPNLTKRVLRSRARRSVREARFRCQDCQSETWHEYYHVHNHLWDDYGAGQRQLCVGCLEKRLGRALVREDFSTAPINHYPLIRSTILRARLRVAQGWIDMRHGLSILDWDSY